VKPLALKLKELLPFFIHFFNVITGPICRWHYTWHGNNNFPTKMKMRNA
jgi:hypothetical protein